MKKFSDLIIFISFVFFGFGTSLQAQTSNTDNTQKVRFTSGPEIHIDTPEAHIIVVPPVNRWHPSTRQQKTSLRGATYYGNPKSDQVTDFAWQKDRKSSSMLNWSSDEPLMSTTLANLVADGGHKASGWFSVHQIAGPLIDLTASEAKALQLLQWKAFLSSSIAFSPDSQENQMLASRLVSAAFDIALANFLSKEFTNGVANSLNGGHIVNLENSTLKFVSGGSRFLVPKEAGLSPMLFDASVGNFVAFDFSKFQEIQYRWIEMWADRQSVSGDIYIAYKVPKTPELELSLQSKAIIAAFGFGQSTEQIQAIRDTERATRQKIWDECVSAGACK